MSDTMERDIGRMEAILENHEAHMASMQEEFCSINAKLEILPKLPTKDNLVTYFIASLGVGLAVIALVIGGLSAAWAG